VVGENESDAPQRLATQKAEEPAIPPPPIRHRRGSGPVLIVHDDQQLPLRAFSLTRLHRLLRLLDWLCCGLLRLGWFGRLLRGLCRLLRSRLGGLLPGLGGLGQCGHGNFPSEDLEILDWKN
jgi:hypothetical protein